MPSARFARLTLLLLAACATFSTLSSRSFAAVNPINPNQKTVHLDGTTQWLDTGVDLSAQDQVTFAATGTLNYETHTVTPDGLPRGWRDLMRALPLSSSGTVAVIGRIGPVEAPVFLVGAKLQKTAAVSGRLFLGINRLANDAITGPGFDVNVQWTRAASASASSSASGSSVTPAPSASPSTTAVTTGAAAQTATTSAQSTTTPNANSDAASSSVPANPSAQTMAVNSGSNILPSTTSSQPASGSNQPSDTGNAHTATAQPSAKANDLPATTLNVPSLPIRVNDGKGHDGDMVNLLLVGTKEQVMAAYAGAAWTQADKSVKQALLHGALSSFSKDAYVAMPMSQLMLYDRYQDLSYEHAEAISVAASRHHLRLWKAPFQIDGNDVWVGAATHDIGFDRDNRNGGITHKIDPDVDLEREFVRSSLWNSGLVTSAAYYTPPQPLTTAKTATGEEFHSDGRVLVLNLTPSTNGSPH